MVQPRLKQHAGPTGSTGDPGLTVRTGSTGGTRLTQSTGGTPLTGSRAGTRPAAIAGWPGRTADTSSTVCATSRAGRGRMRQADATKRAAYATNLEADATKRGAYATKRAE
jgi:hypothetical protein